jgi:hypothetical protein
VAIAKTVPKKVQKQQHLFVKKATKSPKVETCVTGVMIHVTETVTGNEPSLVPCQIDGVG